MQGLYLIFALICALSVQNVHGLHYPQYFQTFDLLGCLGPSLDFLETTTSMRNISELNSAKSYTIRGLWIKKAGGMTTTIWTLQSGRTCGSPVHYPGPEDNRLESVTRVVPADLDDSVLTLFALNNFRGESKIVDDVEKRFDEPFNVRSWAFTGPKSFTIYDGDNYTGNATCLEVDSSTVHTGWGLEAGWGNEAGTPYFVVHSVRSGCDGNAVRRIKGDVKQESSRVFQGDKEIIKGKPLRLQKLPEIKWV